MCGIAGIFDTSGVSETEIYRMLSVLEHRGPDDTGVCCRGPVRLGARRLSIIDLEGSHQPLSIEAQDLQLLFNGIIYN